ncbi:MAG: SpoIIIAH-like family protein [Oscillospiraceae bacterium]|nr:SpoIIIAH-like family protein [Oscillospiraceae bacterium]
MKIWKRNAIVAGVLVLVCAGIYLNWLYGGEAVDLTKTLDADKIMGESTLVMSDGQQLSLDAANTDTSTQTAVESFAQMRLTRQTARAAAVELLQETIAYAEGEDTQSSSAELEQIVASALQEAQVESLVKAKGYFDCVAYINDSKISVAVSAPAEGLTQADVSLVADIVLSQTDFKLSDIYVFGVD